jgi:hypothetical protein
MLYGSGACVGFIGKDTVSFSGLSVPNFKFGQMTILGPRFAEPPTEETSHFEGILGLGFPTIAETNTSLLFAMAAQGVLDDPVFGVYMTKTKTPGANGGKMTLGGYDKNLITGDISYHRVTRPGYWQMHMDGIQVGDLKLKPRGGYEVISDTGTSLIVGPEDEVMAIGHALGAQYVKEAGLFALPCSAASQLPDLVFTFDGIQYHVDAESYLLSISDDPQAKEVCILGLQKSAPANGVDWILGDVFIRDVYQIYDMKNMRVGFAKAKHHNGRQFPDEKEGAR